MSTVKLKLKNRGLSFFVAYAIQDFQKEIKNINDLSIKVKRAEVEFNPSELKQAVNLLIKEKVIKHTLTGFEIINQDQFNEYVEQAIRIKLLEIG